MKEFIEKEKARLQALFEPFNTGGSWMTLADKGRTPVRVGIVDGFIVTRVAPQFDAGGNVTRVDFWLLIRLSGYDEGFQHVCCKIEVGKVARQKSPDVQGGNPRECKGAIESLTGSPLPFWCYPGTEGEGMEDAHHDPGS